ncbi:MAG: DUF6470 family protein [Eubacteriales bacterium]
MKQLLQIQIVPIKVELRKTDAKIQYQNAKVEHQMNTRKGGAQMQTKHAKLHTETFLVPETTVAESIRDYSNKGNQVALESTAKTANRTQSLGEVKPGEELITQFARQDSFKNIKMNIGIDWIPERAPEVTYEDGGLDYSYQPDKLEFDWNLTDQKLHFEHGKIDLVVTQRPEVIIEYVGDPLYVPRSSDPNYRPVNTKG